MGEVIAVHGDIFLFLRVELSGEFLENVNVFRPQVYFCIYLGKTECNVPDRVKQAANQIA